jgi:hypothetical protein
MGVVQKVYGGIACNPQIKMQQKSFCPKTTACEAEVEKGLKGQGRRVLAQRNLIILLVFVVYFTINFVQKLILSFYTLLMPRGILLYY